MSLRFFADHCVPTSVVQALREAGHEVLRLKDHLPPDSPDEAVTSKAQELNCILISLEKDFADIVAFRPSRYGGIIALQLRKQTSAVPQLVDRLKRCLYFHPGMPHYAGKAFVRAGSPHPGQGMRPRP